MSGLPEPKLESKQDKFAHIIYLVLVTICLRTPPPPPNKAKDKNPYIALIRKNMFIVWGVS